MSSDLIALGSGRSVSGRLTEVWTGTLCGP